MSKEVWVCLAHGFEEVEALSPVDYLRRAGAKVSLLSLERERLVAGAHDIRVESDAFFLDVFKEGGKLPDALVLPGGLPASETLAKSAALAKAILATLATRGLIAAICAAPALVLAPTGMLSERRWTCYPTMEEGLNVGVWVADRVVKDGRLITARGPGCAEEFSLAIIEELFGKEEKNKIAEAILAR